MKVIREIRESLKIIPSGESTDFISPSFGWGCLYNCSYAYWHIKNHKPKELSIAKNTNQILKEIKNHSVFAKLQVEKPNSNHKKFITYDIGCNEDFAFHLKHHEWKRIFDFFKYNNQIMASFTTRYVNKKLLKYNPKEKIRIKLNMIPEIKRKLHEPETSTIQERVEAIDKFKEAGYEVHLNFNPIIVYDGWLDDYEELFALINNNVRDEKNIFAECKFLIHDANRHYYNLFNGLNKEEKDLWKPEMQEGKQIIKYKEEFKKQFIDAFIKEHNNVIPWNTIKYIF